MSESGIAPDSIPRGAMHCAETENKVVSTRVNWCGSSYGEFFEKREGLKKKRRECLKFKRDECCFKSKFFFVRQTISPRRVPPLLTKPTHEILKIRVRLQLARNKSSNALGYRLTDNGKRLVHCADRNELFQRPRLVLSASRLVSRIRDSPYAPRKICGRPFFPPRKPRR